MAGTALIWDLLAKDSASPAFLKVAGAADKAAASTARATAGMSASAAKMGAVGATLTKRLTLPLAAIGAVSVAQAMKWQKSMTLIQTAGGETAAKAAELSTGLKKLATETGTSLDALGEGIYVIAKAGAQKWSATEQLQVMKAAAEGAKAENVSLAVATDALSTVMLDYHSKASDAVKIENQLIRASGLAKTTFQEFSTSLANVTPIAAATGLSFKEIGGAIATMTQHGVSAQQATENLRNLIFNLSGQNNVASQAMQQLGINTVDLSKHLGDRGLTGTLAIVDKALRDHTRNGVVTVDVHKAAALATKSLNTELGTFTGKLKDQSQGLLKGNVSILEYTKYAKSLGGSAGASALQFLALVKNSKGFSDQLRSGKGTITTTVQQYQKMLGGMTGAAVAMQIAGKYAKDNARNVREVGKAALEAGSDVLGWNETQQTLAVKMDKAKASLQVMAVEIGTALIPAVSKLADLFGKAAHWFDGLDSGQKKLLAWSAGIMFAIGPVLSIGSRLLLVGRGLNRFALMATSTFQRVTTGSAEMSAGVRASVGRMTAGIAGAGIGVLFGTMTKGSSDATKAVGALGAAAAGAAIGFGVGGPWGAAIGGATGLVGSLATSFLGASDATKKETQALLDQKQAALELAGVLDSTPFSKQGAAIKTNAIQQLTTSGAYDKGNSYNISPRIITSATLGDERALNQIWKRIYKANGDLGKSWNDVSQKSKDAIRGINGDMFDAQEKARQAEVAYENASEAAGKLAFAHVTLAHEVKVFGTTLDTTTAYGQRNTFVLQQHAAAISTDASAMVRQGISAAAVARAVGEHAAALQRSAEKAGFNGAAVSKLISTYTRMPKKVVTDLVKTGVVPADIVHILDKYNLIPHSLATDILLRDHATPRIQAIANALANLHDKTVTVTTTNRGINIGGRASGGGLPDGVSAVGERGPELAIKSGRNVQILSNAQSRGFLAATGMRAPGFAGGTGRAPTGSKLQDVNSGVAATLAAAHNILSTASDFQAAAKQLLQAARAVRLSTAGQALLVRAQTRLYGMARERDSVRNRLGQAPTAATAYDRLATARSAFFDARSSVAQGVAGFDITTAGAGTQVYNDQAAPGTTASSILAAIKTAAAKATRFAGLLRKLGKEGLPRDLLLQLAQAGPSALDQAQALSAATPAQMLGIRSAYSQIQTAGSSAGTDYANRFYKAGVDSAQGLVNGLLSREAALNKAIKRLGDSMVRQLKHELHIKSPSRVMMRLGAYTGEGFELGVRSRVAHVQRAAKDLGNAALPASQAHRWQQAAGGGVTIEVHGIEDPSTFVRHVETKLAHRAQILGSS